MVFLLTLEKEKDTRNAGLSLRHRGSYLSVRLMLSMRNLNLTWP